jgi:hypothetical protein
VLPVGWLVVAVLVAVLLTLWITFTLTRLDRLHARVDAAQASMDAQLVRRAAALMHVAESNDQGLLPEVRAGYQDVAARALAADGSDAERQDAENAVGRAITDLAEQRHSLRPAAAAELHEAAARVLIARRFYNDAVRDTRALRVRRLPRLFRMAGRRPMPDFFDIDDTVSTAIALPARPPVPPARPPVPRTMEEDRP